MGPSITHGDVGLAKRSAENGPSVKRVEVAPAKERVKDVDELDPKPSPAREVTPAEKDGLSVTRMEVPPTRSSEKDGMSITRVQVSPAKSQSLAEDSENKTEEVPELSKPSEDPVKESCEPSDEPEHPAGAEDGKSPMPLRRALSDGGWGGKAVKRRSAWASMVCTVS